MMGEKRDCLFFLSLADFRREGIQTEKLCPLQGHSLIFSGVEGLFLLYDEHTLPIKQVSVSNQLGQVNLPNHIFEIVRLIPFIN